MHRVFETICLLLISTVLSATPVLEFDADNGRVETIRNLDVDGTLYNVSFDQAFGEHLFVGDELGANAAVDAIIGLLNPHRYFVDNLHPVQVAVFWVATDAAGPPGVSACVSSYLPGTCADEWTNVGDFFNTLPLTAAALFERVPTEVGIDVLPGDPANVVYPNRAGKLPVAVLSSPVFDATQVNPATLKFGLGEAAPADPVDITDVDGEYGPDTLAKFSVPETGIFCDDEEVSLSGETYAGDPIVGADAIDASECETGGCHSY